MSRATFPHLIASVFLFLAPAWLDAETVTLAPVRDNTLYESATGASSNGAGQYFYAGRSNQVSNSRRRALLAFEVAGTLPRGARILAAKLTLRMSRTGNPAAGRVELHRLAADWGEGGSDAGEQGGDGAASAPLDATWQHRFFSDRPWSAPGGDFDAAVSAATEVGALGAYVWSAPAMAADVQAWLDDPASDFGWVLIGDETAMQTSKRFDSRENALASSRPRLEIDYAPPVETPALSTWELAALAGLSVVAGAVLLRRRAAAAH